MCVYIYVCVSLNISVYIYIESYLGLTSQLQRVCLGCMLRVCCAAHLAANVPLRTGFTHTHTASATCIDLAAGACRRTKPQSARYSVVVQLLPSATSFFDAQLICLTQTTPREFQEAYIASMLHRHDLDA